MNRTRRSRRLSRPLRLGLAGVTAFAFSVILGAPALAEGLPNVSLPGFLQATPPPATPTASPSSTPAPAPPVGNLGTTSFLPSPPVTLPVPTPLPTAVAGVCVGLAACPTGPTDNPTPTTDQSSTTPPIPPGTATSGPLSGASPTADALSGSSEIAQQAPRPVSIEAQTAGTGFIREIPPPPVSTIGAVPGMNFGQVPLLWPLFVLLDVIAAGGVLVVVRRTWSSPSASS